ncbi:FKBP-type peptidyl-prolyl cis-trans isomerase [Pontibacter sp. KCTC 32443]|nr:FKBP-type peptidyl-prolyl cis-trans isomerase [Pontibacter sp. KCTC 32443]
MTVQALKQRFFKGSSLLQCLLLVITIVSLASCTADEDPFYFDVEAQKVKDEAIIRQYFRDNNVDTTAVVRTESGLYYLKVSEGEGEEIDLGDSIQVHYIGKYTSNLKFDSSWDKADAFEFRVEDGNVIDGWVEGMQEMKVGGHYFLYVPSYLAYGPYGSGNVPPNSVLIFDIDVLAKFE